MKGFKDSTRTQYSMGGAAYAKGGSVKGAAKVAKVMGEFKKGELHSGSKEGPKVTKPAQAKAIAMSEARKAGMKAPMKKNEGGKVGKMPPLGETMKSVRRLPPELTPEQMRALEDRFVTKKRPSLGETMESVGRLPKELTPEQMRALEEGSAVQKKAVGGSALKGAMKSQRMQKAINKIAPKMNPMSVQPIMETTPGLGMEPPLMVELPSSQMVYDMVQPRVMPPVDPGFAIGPREPVMPPRAGMVGGLLGALNNPRMQQDLQQAMMQQMPMGGGIGAELGRIGQRPGFVNSRSFVNPGPAGPPPAGMAPVDPNQAMMMKHGGRAAMSKGKR
jgi:hypothetical protein